MIVSGTGAGQARTIGTNTSTQLTLSTGSSWGTAPDATSTYAIVPLAANQSGTGTGSNGPTATILADTSQPAQHWTVDQWKGRLVEITGGPGAGHGRPPLHESPAPPPGGPARDHPPHN